mmetsp:Transcript_13084/g.25187  ORF Transcript_13084/g.25187 Transcript_13084/m.25187 type:complete len:410 (+) Transcript_13084:261-1490(+)
MLFAAVVPAPSSVLWGLGDSASDNIGVERPEMPTRAASSNSSSRSCSTSTLRPNVAAFFNAMRNSSVLAVSKAITIWPRVRHRSQRRASSIAPMPLLVETACAARKEPRSPMLRCSRFLKFVTSSLGMLSTTSTQRCCSRNKASLNARMLISTPMSSISSSSACVIPLLLDRDEAPLFAEWRDNALAVDLGEWKSSPSDSLFSSLPFPPPCCSISLFGRAAIRARVAGELSFRMLLPLLLLLHLLLLLLLPPSGSDTALALALVRSLPLDAATLATSADAGVLTPSDMETVRKKSIPLPPSFGGLIARSALLALSALLLVFGNPPLWLLLLLLLPTCRSLCCEMRPNGFIPPRTVAGLGASPRGSNSVVEVGSPCEAVAGIRVALKSGCCNPRCSSRSACISNHVVSSS